MNEFLSDLQEFLVRPQVRSALIAAAILIAGLLLWRLFSRWMHSGSLQSQQRLILRRIGNAVILVVSVAWALSELGLNIGVVLGAAGVLTIAIGFASQKSVSNVISGVFLMAERPFGVGDVIKVGDVTGSVLSIDSLSVKLRTFDNLLVRIPNATMLEANVTNMSHFPIRRYDMQISVAYGTDIPRVRELLFNLAHRVQVCMIEPEPLVIFLAFGDSGLHLQFSTWATRENFLELRNQMHDGVRILFEKHGIEIPYPQRTVRLVGPEAGPVEPTAAAPTAPGDPEAVQTPHAEGERET